MRKDSLLVGVCHSATLTASHPGCPSVSASTTGVNTMAAARFGQMRGDGVDCNFECVEATPKACTKVNPKEPIPDKKMGICRACLVDGCDVRTTDGQDTCATCQPGYTLKNGKCDSNNAYSWYALVPSVLSCFWFSEPT